jgi:competence protein ComEC
MIPGVLALSMVAGIVAGIGWSDTGHRLPLALVTAWSLFAGVLICALWTRIHSDLRRPLRRSDGSRALWVSGVICTAGLAFFAGYEGLDREFLRAQRDGARAQRELRKAVRIAEARVVSRRAGRFGDEVELVSVRAVDGGASLPENLLLRLGEYEIGPADAMPSRDDRLLWPGAWVRVGLRVSPFRSARNPGTPDREHQASRRGQAARARLVKPDWVLALSGGPHGWQRMKARVTHERAAWRQRVASRLEKEGRAGALVAALGLGDRGPIQPETREAFRRMGLSHLLAVSGLHVGFVAGLAGWLFVRMSAWVCRRGRNTLPFDWALGVACAAAALYAWITGAGISVERATLLFGLFAACRLCLRSVAPAAALAWVAVGILLMDPAALFDVGAQLSFGACAALIVGGFWTGKADPSESRKRESGPWARIGQAASETFRASLVISLGTAPLLVQHGIALSLFSPAVNVIAIPWLGLVVLPTSLFLVLFSGALPASAVAVLILPVRVFEACVVHVAMLLPEQSGHARLGLPVLVLLICLALLWIRRGGWKWAVLVWIGISMAGGTPGLVGPFVPRSPQVVIFDVGQGDASLIQGREAVLLIDTGSGPPDGSGGTGLVRGLRALGVDSIDVLAVTHADLDHRAGAERVLASFSVDELWLPISGIRDAPLLVLSKNARRRGTRVRWLAAGARGTARGDLAIQVLWPSPSLSSKIASRNDGSLVLRVGVDEMTFLFTADIGVRVEEELRSSGWPIDADVLKVAHHGSRGSSSEAFLESVSATAMLLSAPCDPTRGLPNSKVLDRLARSGASLWWTGRDGAIIVSRDPAGKILAKGWGRSRQCGPRGE